MFRNNLPGFRFYRMAEDGGSSGDAHGSSATTSTGGDGKTTTVGQAADASQQASSASASVPSIATGGDQAAASAAAAGDFKASLGDLVNDPTIKDVTDVKTLAQRLIDTKKLVGQKLGIPDANATPEAKAAFYKAMGVPDGADGYELEKLPEGTSEEVKAGFDPEHAKKWAGIFKANNIPAPVAKALQGEMMKEVMAEVEKMKADTSRTDADFDKVATATFGDKKGAVLQQAQVDLVKYAPVELRKYIENAPNTVLAAVAATVNGIRKELGGEDKAIGSGGDSTSGQSAGQLRQEMRTLMAQPEFSSPFAKGKEAHQAARDKVNSMAKQISELERQGKK